MTMSSPLVPTHPVAFGFTILQSVLSMPKSFFKSEKSVYHFFKIFIGLQRYFTRITVTVSGVHTSFRSTRYFCRQVSSIPRISDVPHDGPPDKQLGDRNKQEAVSFQLSAQSTPPCPRFHPTAKCIKIRAETRT